MNGRKARGRRRALRRSRENTGRLMRKAERVETNEREQELEEALGKARAERDALLASANKAFRKSVKALEETRAEDRKRAWDDYGQQRTKLLKEFAESQREAA